MSNGSVRHSAVFLATISLTLTLGACSGEDSVEFRAGSIESNAVGRAEIGPEDNLGNIPVDVMLFNLPDPSDLHAQGKNYVVWGKLPDGKTNYLGEVYIQDAAASEGRLLTTTTDRAFKLLVTIEEDDDPSAPSGAVLLESEPFSIE